MNNNLARKKQNAKEKEILGDLGVILGCLGAVALFIYAVIMNGIIIQAFWGWFIQTIFHTAPDIMFAQALGLGMFVSYITGTYSMHRYLSKLDDSSLSEKVFVAVATPILILIVGFILHLFI